LSGSLTDNEVDPAIRLGQTIGDEALVIEGKETFSFLHAV